MKNSNDNKLLVILGPTASGKSDLAIALAKKFNGEIISADSRQVYKKMDLGTGKVPKDSRRLFHLNHLFFTHKKENHQSEEYFSQGIRHYLLDVADPKEYFSVAQYQQLAFQAIQEIQKRHKLPILCGGTGLYLSAIIDGWQFLASPPNPSLREKLNQLSLEELQTQLKKLDPQKAQTIDLSNKRRIIRALEILSQLPSLPPLTKIPPPWQILILGIQKNKAELKTLIEKRLEKRLKEGMIEEVQKLKEEGVSSQRLEDFGLEYRWINRYLEGKISYEEMKMNLLKDIEHFAKRQMTWFKNQIFNSQENPNRKCIWITHPQEAFDLVSQFLANQLF